VLVLWEAQFGDFANGAQVIIDQFIASAETKWLRMSGLVMLLPHGFEGQGPEHSSARLERYLQLCAERNMRCRNITTPANYFHALRRQLKANYRKPLVLMTPKSLLRHKLAVSSLADFGPAAPSATSSRDRRLVPDEQVKRVVLCSGKVYYDLLQARRDAKQDDVAIIRVEQLTLPVRSLPVALAPTATPRWCGARRSRRTWGLALRGPQDREGPARPGHEGEAAGLCRPPDAASPATGLAKVHQQEQDALVKSALGL
jgi:2-oxoglutarate dehydrogenase E1 component